MPLLRGSTIVVGRQGPLATAVLAEGIDACGPPALRLTAGLFSLMSPVTGLSWAYAALLRRLSPDFPVYGLQPRARSDLAELPHSVEQLVGQFADEVMKVQPDGAYRLLGASDRYWMVMGLTMSAVSVSSVKAPPMRMTEYVSGISLR